ncbi:MULTISPECIES: Ig-like domain-containing protein [Myxococcus]|uniref:adventurous gliding motility protein AgmC n=3 Tax=Myxococcaceae TaxID=31 RepID=UPI002649E99B|nr:MULTISPECIES: Ig-like domain-containing protein [Myxococcus]
MKGTGLKAALAAGVLLSAIVAVAGPDTFFLGLGSDGLTVPSAQNQPTEVQVNTYAPVIAITTTSEGRPQLMLGNRRQGNAASNFANDRLVMVLQTTGITPTEVPDEAFEQDTLELGNSAVGRWELGTITGFNSTTGALVLSQPLKYSYAPDATQVILVPQYTSVTVADGARIEALPWDGASGGVVAFLAQEGIQLNGTGVISAASAGFRGGVFTREEVEDDPAEGCDRTDDGAGDFRLGMKGEGLSTTRYTGAGALRGLRNFTHGGGGGVCKQSGGGGGGNAGMGGLGGRSMDGSRSMGGRGGTSLSYSPLDHLTFGGGGGSGQGHTATAPAPNGGRGGGIVFLRAASLSGGRVDASGASAAESSDSGGGGGAGGSISVRLTETCSTTAIVANGGNGGDVDSVQSGTVNAAGPGGGGGGGRVLLQAGASSTCPISVDSGVAGLTSDDGEAPVARGAMPPASSIRLPPYVGSVTFLVGGMPEVIAAPELTIANALVKTTSPLVTGTGAPGAGLLIYRNRPGQASVQEFLVRTVIGANGTYAVNVPLQEESNTLKAAVERQGLQGSYSTDLSVTVDTRPPDTRASTSLSFPTNADEITFTVEGDEAEGQRCDNAATRPCTLQCRLTRPSQPTPAFSPCTSVSSHDISAAGGTYRFEARAIDAATNEDPTPAVIEFVVDHDSPDVSIRSTNPAPPVSMSHLDIAAFGFDSNASDLDRFECRLGVAVPPEEDPEYGAWATCPANHVLSGLLHGHGYTLEVRAVDRAGNQSPEDTHPWTVDLVAPDTEFTDALPEVTSQNVPFAFGSDDTDVVRFECSLDSAPFATCTSPFTPVTPPVDGTHTLQVRAVDEAGNVDPTPAMHTWVVDTDGPPATIRLGPPDPSNQATAGFDFDSTAADVVRFECQLAEVPATGSSTTGTWATCPASKLYSNLTHGSRYTLLVRAVDRADNRGMDVPHSWTVDLVAPDTEFTAALPEVTSQNVPFAFSSNDTDVVRFECSLDSAPFATCTSPFTPVTPPADGTHTLQVRAVDEAGNVDPTPAMHTWVVDTDGPPATIRLGPPDPSNQATAGFDFDSTAADVVRFECQLAEVPATGSSTTGTWATCPASKLYSNLTHGSRYTLLVRAVDRADNRGTDVPHSWTVDLVAPDTEFTAALPEVTSQNVPFAFGSDDTDVVRFECSLDSAPFATCTSPFTPVTPPTDGTHALQVRAVDEAGNVDPTPVMHMWVVDTAAPDTAISLTSPVPPRNPNNSRSAAFGFTSSAPDVVRFECRLDTTEPESTTGTWQTCPSAHVINDLVNGTTYRLHVRAVDRAGNSDASPASHLWRVDVTPPNTVFTQAPAELTSDLVATFGFASPQDSDVDYYECSLDGDPFERCVSGVEFQVDDGVHKMLIRAVDTAGNVDDTPATHVWRVDSGPVITEIRARPPQLTNESVARFVFTSNKGHVAFRCKLDDQAEVDCGSITPDPEDRETEHPFNVSDGRHTLNVHAVDQDNGDRDETGASYTWSVDTVAPGPPLITEPITAYVNTTTPVIRGTAPEAGTVTVYLGALNVGQAATSGTLSWELSGLQLEERQYTLRATLTDPASNTGSLNASEPRVFTVDVTPPDTTITGAPPARGRERTVTFEFEHRQEVNFAGFQCSLNDEQYRDCTTPYEVMVPQDGTYLLSVRARDLAGNLDPTPATHTWLVDSKRPETSIINKPGLFDHSSRSVFLFGSDEEEVRYECSLNGAAFAPCDNPVTLPPLSQVAHTLQVRAVDSVENVDDSPESYTWTVDDTPPEVPSLSFPTPGALVETRTPQFRGTALGEASEVVIRVDGDERGRASVDGAGQWRFTLTGSLPDGEHSVSVYAVDLARNQSAASELVTFTLIPSTEIDSRGGGLSCSLGGSGQAPVASLGFVAFALLAARRRRQP